MRAEKSSGAAAALLASPQRAVRTELFRERVIEVAALVEIFGLSMSGNLQRSLSDRQPANVVEPLLGAGLVQRHDGKLSGKGNEMAVAVARLDHEQQAVIARCRVKIASSTQPTIDHDMGNVRIHSVCICGIVAHALGRHFFETLTRRVAR